MNKLLGVIFLALCISSTAWAQQNSLGLMREWARMRIMECSGDADNSKIINHLLSPTVSASIVPLYGARGVCSGYNEGNEISWKCHAKIDELLSSTFKDEIPKLFKQYGCKEDDRYLVQNNRPTNAQQEAAQNEATRVWDPSVVCNVDKKFEYKSTHCIGVYKCDPNSGSKKFRFGNKEFGKGRYAFSCSVEDEAQCKSTSLSNCKARKIAEPVPFGSAPLTSSGWISVDGNDSGGGSSSGGSSSSSAAGSKK